MFKKAGVILAAIIFGVVSLYAGVFTFYLAVELWPKIIYFLVGFLLTWLMACLGISLFSSVCND
jgi:hypothetical protein